MTRLLAVLLLAAPALAACHRPNAQADAAGGNPRRGARLIASVGCGACHSIHRIRTARGRVGPPLDTVGDRTIIAGMLPNTPPNLIYWLQHPQNVVPGNAMPDIGLNATDARDIATYLYTLR